MADIQLGKSYLIPNSPGQNTITIGWCLHSTEHLALTDYTNSERVFYTYFIAKLLVFMMKYDPDIMLLSAVITVT